MGDYFWLFATAGGAFILGAVMAYALLRARPLTPREQAAQDRKVEEMYNEETR